MELTAKELGMRFDELVEIWPGRPGEDAQYWLDSTRIKQELGWEPEISLEGGVRDMVAWGRKYIDQLRDASAEYVLRT